MATAKTLLAEQSSRLSQKHNTDLELLDDLRIYLKARCSIERDYAQSLVKLTSAHGKKSQQLVSAVPNEEELSDTR